MSSESLEGKVTSYDSGASRFGNFINYYQFNPPENRLRLLPSHIWNIEHDKDVVCFDIGCNVGVCTATFLVK